MLKDIKDNIVCEDIEAELVYGMRVQYLAFEFTKFKKYLSSLLEFADKCRVRAADAKAAVEHDVLLQIYDPNKWHGSDAERLLAEDIKAGIFKEGLPSYFWRSRPEYQQFSLDKFRSHLYQGRRPKSSGFKDKKMRALRSGIPVEKEKEIVISEM